MKLTKKDILKRLSKDELLLLRTVEDATKSLSKDIKVSENSIVNTYKVTRRGVGILNTRHGKFWQYDFYINDDWGKYSVIVKGKLDKGTLYPIFKDAQKLLLRIDSGCETGQVFGDLTCECSDQLHLALAKIAEIDEGIIVNIPQQDGRGMSLPFKLGTLWLQDEMGVNTVESALLLSENDIVDKRSYSGVICILKFLNIDNTYTINLATNNYKKTQIFEGNGYNLTDCMPVIIKPTKYTIEHLKAKQKHLGHTGLTDTDNH